MQKKILENIVKGKLLNKAVGNNVLTARFVDFFCFSFDNVGVLFIQKNRIVISPELRNWIL